MRPQRRGGDVALQNTQAPLVLVRDGDHGPGLLTRSRGNLPTDAMPVASIPDNGDQLHKPRSVGAAAFPHNVGAKGKRSQATFTELAVQLTLAVLRALAHLLPGIADAPEGLLNLFRSDAVAIVDDLRGDDRLRRVALQHHDDVGSFSVNGIPDELDDGPNRVTLVGQPTDQVVARREHHLRHEMTLRTEHHVRAERHPRGQRTAKAPSSPTGRRS